MVEFGLKLIDNRVSEWKDNYIDYETLQLLLKKAVEARDKLKDLKARYPEAAQSVAATDEEEDTEKREDSSRIEIAPWNSTAATLSDTAVAQTETTQFIHSIDSVGSSGNIVEEYSRQSGSSSPRLKKSDSVLSIIARSDSSVTQWTYNKLFPQSGFKNKLKSASSNAMKKKKVFDDRLYEEMNKVENFYVGKLQELKDHLRVLVEDTKTILPTIPTRQDSDSSTTTKRWKTLTSSIMEKWQSALKQSNAQIQYQQQSHRRLFSDPSYGNIQHYGSLVTHDSDDENLSITMYSSNTSVAVRPGEAESIKRALADLYRWAKLLENYSILNYTGFVKIIKRHDKNFPSEKDKFRNIFNSSTTVYSFSSSIDAEKLCEHMETIFAKWFCKGNRREAAIKILPKKGDGLDMDWSQLRLGFRLGMCTILLLWVCWDCIWGFVAQGQSTIGGRVAFPVFRACGGLLLWHWCWGISVYIWSRYRVNYIYLFDFDPRLVDTPVKIFTHCVNETLVFLVCMLLYYKAGVMDIPQLLPPGAYPVILIFYTIRNLVTPWKTRGRLWKGISQVITSPMTPPTFFTIYLGDVFASMVKVFQDVCWSICFVLSGDFGFADRNGGSLRNWQVTFWYKNLLIPLVCLLPLWFRFCQCLRRYVDSGARFPHLANAFKYALSQTVTLFGAFHPLYLLTFPSESKNKNNWFQGFWLLLFVSSSLYSFFWDVYMDWGLGRPKYGFLGPRLMYPSKYHYYGVMCADFFLRFMWVLTLVPPQSGARFELPNYMAAVQMSVELLRRMLWGSFRLEQEHRANTEGYRRVGFVPLHFTTGHDNKYKNSEEAQGRRVLTEVLLVVTIVVFLSVSSAITAMKSAKEYQHEAAG